MRKRPFFFAGISAGIGLLLGLCMIPSLEMEAFYKERQPHVFDFVKWPFLLALLGFVLGLLAYFVGHFVRHAQLISSCWKAAFAGGLLSCLAGVMVAVFLDKTEVFYGNRQNEFASLFANAFFTGSVGFAVGAVLTFVVYSLSNDRRANRDR